MTTAHYYYCIRIGRMPECHVTQFRHNSVFSTASRRCLRKFAL